MTTETKRPIVTKGEYAMYLKKALGYDQYKEQMESDAKTNTDTELKEYINMNQHRMHRVEKTYKMSEGMAALVAGLKYKTLWLILTEHWCGDAAQNLPVFQHIAENSNGKIELKLVYRDQNPDLMDAWLTGTSRSIPRLIQLNEHNDVTGIWGPRPTEAQELVVKLKADPETAPGYGEALHLWYAKNKQQALEPEIEQLIMRANMMCPDCIS